MKSKPGPPPTFNTPVRYRFKPASILAKSIGKLAEISFEKAFLVIRLGCQSADNCLSMS